MSALGQKQTFAAQKAMSALPPKATSNATCGMSAKGQKQTPRSLDHLIGCSEQRRRDGQSKCFCGLEVDHELEFRWLLDRQIRRLGAFQYLVDKDRRFAKYVLQIRSVRHEPARHYVCAVLEHGRESCCCWQNRECERDAAA